MIDKNNLNRIKGILSAKKGAEIPKFTPGGSISFSSINLNTPLSTPLKSNQFEISVQLLKNKYPNLPFNMIMQMATDQTYNPIDYSTFDTKLSIINDASNTLTTNTTSSIAPPVELASIEEIETEEKSAGMNKINALNKISNMTDKQKKIGENIGLVMSSALTGIGDAIEALQAATDSNTTKTVNAGYDVIASGLEQAGGIAGIVGTGLKYADMVGDIAQSMGGGTDQLTATDKWMDSSFFSWNIGMINGFAGKNSDKFSLDQNTLSQVGSSYGGFVSEAGELAQKADKKYGLFSNKERKKVNAEIAEAKSQQSTLNNIAKQSANLRLQVQSMGEQAGLAYSLMTDGGYNQKYTYAAKQGGLLEWNPTIELEWEPKIEINWELPTFKEGGNIDIVEELEWIPEFKESNKLDFNTWFNSIPVEYRADRYDYKKAYKVFDWDLLSKHAKDPKNNHLGSVSPVADENGNFPFLKLGKLDENKELQGEFDWYNSEEGKEHKNKYDIKFMNGRYYYVPKQLKQGGSIRDSDIPEIEETFQKNVIPEGALHKNKHHMEHAEGLTKKGIPVIDDNGEQQAEIEHSEIIFTLEVTKKLEEYYKIFYSEESSNKEKELAALDAGKLLVYQILENTEDRTGLIESCKKGGTLTIKESETVEDLLDWVPTIMIVEEIKEEKPKKKSELEKDDLKEQVKDVIREALIELLIK